MAPGTRTGNAAHPLYPRRLHTPAGLAPLALQNKRLIYNLLFPANAETVLEIVRDPRHFGAKIGFFSVLHTWDQRLQLSLCSLCSSRLAPDHARRISSHYSFFLPSKCSAVCSRGKFVAALKIAFREAKIEFQFWVS